MSLGVLGGGSVAGQRRRISMRPRGMQGLGGTQQIPAACWDKPGFKDCNAQGWDAAEKKCRVNGVASSLAVSDYGGNIDACKQDQADNYAYAGCVLRICPPAAAPRPTSAGGWNWMNTTPNASVQLFQQHLNTALVAQGYKPITADGRLGPATCGAWNFIDAKKYASLFANDPIANIGICQSFTNPTKVGSSTPDKLPVSAEAKKLDQQFGGLPWMAADSRVAALQQQINLALDANNFLPIPVSGMLDPATCGAILWLDANTGTNLFATWGPRGGGACPSTIAPKPKPVPVATPVPVVTPKPSTSTPVTAEASAGGVSALGVGLLAALAVGGYAWWKSKSG